MARHRRRGCTCNPRQPWDPCRACEAAADRLEAAREFEEDMPDGADRLAEDYEKWYDRRMDCGS